MTLSFEEAASSQNEYRPSNQETLGLLSTITFSPYVGPTAVGKNYLMAHLAKTIGYHPVGNMTTRQLRDNDPWNIRNKSEVEMLRDIEEGKLVQYAAHLGNRALYGTATEDYRAELINIKDIFAHSVESLTRTGFRDVRPVCLLAPPEKWEQRLDKRFKTMDQVQRSGRLDEATESIRWILEGSTSIDRVLVIGDDTYVHENVERIQAFVENSIQVAPEQIHFDTAEQMRKSLPDLRAKYLTKG